MTRCHALCRLQVFVMFFPGIDHEFSPNQIYSSAKMKNREQIGALLKEGIKNQAADMGLSASHHVLARQFSVTHGNASFFVSPKRPEVKQTPYPHQSPAHRSPPPWLSLINASNHRHEYFHLRIRAETLTETSLHSRSTST